MRTKIIFLVLCMFVMPGVLRAAGIQVSPSKLEVVIEKNSAEVSLVVVNPTADVQLFDAYADDFQENIFVNPASFTLEPGERRQIVVTVKAGGKLSGGVVSNTNLSVISKPLAESKVQLGTGVKIPITITTQKYAAFYQGKIFRVVATVVGLLLVVALTLIQNRRRKRAASN